MWMNLLERSRSSYWIIVNRLNFVNLKILMRLQLRMVLILIIEDLEPMHMHLLVIFQLLYKWM